MQVSDNKIKFTLGNMKLISKVIDAELNIQGAGMLMTTLEENQVFEFDETLNL
jgi:hypothetical protein